MKTPTAQALKPCPFCGITPESLFIQQGTTSRWRYGYCPGCEATTGEERIQTCGEGTPKEWEDECAAKIVKAWNTRAIDASTNPLDPSQLIFGEPQTLEELRAELESQPRDAARYRWLRDNMKERLTDGSIGYENIEHRTQYVLPRLIAWANYCGPITLDEAVDAAMSAEKGETK